MFGTTKGFKLQRNFRVRYSHWNFYFCSSYSCNYLRLKNRIKPIHPLSPQFLQMFKMHFSCKNTPRISTFHMSKFISSIYLTFFKLVRRVQVHCRHDKHNNYLTSPTVLHCGKHLYTPFHHPTM